MVLDSIAILGVHSTDSVLRNAQGKLVASAVDLVGDASIVLQ